MRDLHTEHTAPQARLLSHEREERLPPVHDSALTVVILEVLLNPLPLPLSRLKLRSVHGSHKRSALTTPGIHMPRGGSLLNHLTSASQHASSDRLTRAAAVRSRHSQDCRAQLRVELREGPQVPFRHHPN